METQFAKKIIATSLTLAVTACAVLLAVFIKVDRLKKKKKEKDATKSAKISSNPKTVINTDKGTLSVRQKIVTKTKYILPARKVKSNQKSSGATIIQQIYHSKPKAGDAVVIKQTDDSRPTRDSKAKFVRSNSYISAEDSVTKKLSNEIPLELSLEDGKSSQKQKEKQFRACFSLYFMGNVNRNT
ncbi:hypothetical protein HELRODRAFT_182239 [Helobdella robusta]|uniref:Uncharacterized protein n=1 Tax=Helobdella robusta TaxID=6412 RepID=T1FHZ3_HELRO|nr:hypothetical protein HELRODRAFT_182239 [Helobdella robusta]ESN91084.1 hypothetical protein HELRODRAFT_182239 [Helobdella robusta]